MFFFLLRNQVPDFNHLGRVQSRSGLVQNQHLRLPNQSLGNADSLPVSFGQVFNHPVVDITDIGCFAYGLNVFFVGKSAFFQTVCKL